MAAPVLGGLLVADEVIDVFLPVLYFAVQKAKWRRPARSHRHSSGTMVQDQATALVG